MNRELYQTWLMRCRFCNSEFVAEIEQLGEVKEGDEILSQCTECGLIGYHKTIQETPF